jgi:hypothetical protein
VCNVGPPGGAAMGAGPVIHYNSLHTSLVRASFNPQKKTNFLYQAIVHINFVLILSRESGFI